MARKATLLDLVTAFAEEAAPDAEVIATVVRMVNAGIVQLRGSFRGARFDLDDLPVRAARAARAA
ncbi:MAG: hypothetical protein FJ144_27160 [Deltaproteobacteria bacterium]|nr:hypothetical protein [Deltaproteobacteria bacterium]